ncbi:MAG: ATP-binding cassette domain-containing protein [Ignavibacteriales bacterium]|nr:ATP-binding cassette domain-containing protein [Ignavibacteriales bacterium]
MINKSTPPVHKKSEAHDNTTVVALKHLKKSFGSNDVLKDITLQISKGESLVILGKSGTGKSVLIKCIVGLNGFDDGELSILGQDISKISKAELIAVRKKIGFLFQSGALYDSMSVRENLEFPLKRQQKSIGAEDMDAMVKEALDNVGLSQAIDKKPSELSGGMRKRLGLARTLILKPEIMLYDEPTTGLDPITSKEISTLILDVQNKFRTTSIIITHDIECAKRTANRIIVLKEGVCFAEGSYTELENSGDSWIRSFFE